MTGTIIAHVVDVDVGVAAKQLLPSILKNVVVKHLKSSIGRGVYRIRYIGALTIYNPKKLPKPILCTDIYVEPMQSLYCSSRRSLRRERARHLFAQFSLHNRCLPYMQQNYISTLIACVGYGSLRVGVTVLFPSLSLSVSLSSLTFVQDYVVR